MSHTRNSYILYEYNALISPLVNYRPQLTMNEPICPLTLPHIINTGVSGERRAARMSGHRQWEQKSYAATALPARCHLHGTGTQCAWDIVSADMWQGLGTDQDHDQHVTYTQFVHTV